MTYVKNGKVKMNKNECESLGKLWVEGYKKEDGGYVHGYCKDVPGLPVKSNIFPIKDFDMNGDIDSKEMVSPPLFNPDSDDSLASMKVKIPVSNTKNARNTYNEIRNENKRLGKDLKTQDFKDAVVQSKHINQTSEKEMNESDKLLASQAIKAQEIYARQKSNIAKREYGERKKKIHSDTKTMKNQIKSESKRIKHQKKQAKREKKLERLRRK